MNDTVVLLPDPSRRGKDYDPLAEEGYRVEEEVEFY